MAVCSQGSCGSFIYIYMRNGSWTSIPCGSGVECKWSVTYSECGRICAETAWVHGLVSHLVSAVVGLRREEREEGVVLPPREGVGVRDGWPLNDLKLAEGRELLMPRHIPLEAALYELLHLDLLP